ncbi:ABC transporter substrate-binding protein [Methylovirgula sp. 4M-Z18]|uniref:ABC transporter substrate-binding protein n=1 Tax=Methylovirgula sp. 4M-Z18 TaxID=2293567 RepID=UPI001314CFC6|nr:ABC transporter substrate-binding protein [Methylovirgula sp. 4M-Z18]
METPNPEMSLVRRTSSIFVLIMLVLFLAPRATAQERIAPSLVTANATTTLTVYAQAPLARVRDVLTGFTHLNPDIAVKYLEVKTGPLYNAMIRRKAPEKMPDIIWSSAMDRQIKLANDGYALQYEPSELDHLPPQLNWKDIAYGITAEPVVIVYNKRLLSEAQVPHSHAELTEALDQNQALFRGKVGTYDPQVSDTGLLFVTQDLAVTARTWDLVAAMGHCKVRLYPTSAGMIDDVSSGRVLIAYNVLGSYAMKRMQHDPNLGVVWPSDYTLLMSRVALISKASRNQEAAKRFLDYLLSEDGQTRLAHDGLGRVRDGLQFPDISVPVDASALRPIAMNIDLLVYLDQAKREAFLKQWRKLIDG